MSRLVRDMLALSRVESGKQQEADEPFDLHGAVTGAVEIHRHRAETQGVRLDYTHSDEPVVIKHQSKLKSRRSSAERDNRELSPADEQQIWMEVLHGQYTKDEAYFAQFNIEPTGVQRTTVALAIPGDLIWHFPSRYPSKAGIKAAIIGSIWLLAIAAL